MRKHAEELADRVARGMPVTEATDVARLLEAMSHAGMTEQASVLAERAAAYAPARDAGDVAVVLNALKGIAAHEEAERYAGRVIAEVSGSGPATVAPFWYVMRSAGMPTRALELAQRSDEAERADGH
ncbi:hypothetical protein [Actinomadura sp. NEAU-AAG7]|uniref:hypothetical protein n=1 Tax=Actinomadura sp. NEAU-AAG7 TaxID=2839640 RepID=UPI001BE42C58|nr:hypothetical protein [Actinomadura sp. NEAU-AAG7]MBT2210082.1 hypothetical protein [Actinomadura sp. NEAU-AAG7]